MARLEVGPNIDRYIEDLTKLCSESEEICKRAVYEGAKIVADTCRKEIEAVHVESEKEKKAKGFAAGLTRSQKKGLLEGLGIAKFRNTGGYIHVKIGMDGYNSTVTKNYPRGQPNAMIIRAMETGTSFRIRQPVLTRATNMSKAAAEAAIKKQLDVEIKKRIH